MDVKTSKPFVDVVAPVAGQKGPGRWTVIFALELGSPPSRVAELVFARALSAQTEQRELAQKQLAGAEVDFEIPEGFVEDVRPARYASKLICYAGAGHSYLGRQEIRLESKTRRYLRATSWGLQYSHRTT